MRIGCIFAPGSFAINRMVSGTLSLVVRSCLSSYGIEPLIHPFKVTSSPGGIAETTRPKFMGCIHVVETRFMATRGGDAEDATINNDLERRNLSFVF